MADPLGSRVSVQLFQIGYCSHPGCVVEQGCGLAPKQFPNLCALITHPLYGHTLFDTGYHPAFHAATKAFPERLYALTTPVSLGKTMLEQLQAQGIQAEGIQRIILSHFHADHIAGCGDFPAAEYVADEEGFRRLMQLSRFNQVRKGFLKALLPEDFEQRTAWVRAYPQKLSSVLGIQLEHDFDVCMLFKDGSAYLVRLPGHAAGHLGALIKTEKGWVLLAADAYWTQGNLQGKKPSWLARMIMDDSSIYAQTLEGLQALARHHAGTVRLIGSHDEKVINEE